MNSIVRSLVYVWLILLFCGCSGKESFLCSSNCCGKDSSKNKVEKSKSREFSDNSALARTENEPLVCTLTGSELADRKNELQKEVFSKVKKTKEIETGYIFSFEYDERFLVRLTDYVITENKCCPFFTFEIKLHSTNDAFLTITGPPEVKNMIAMFLAEGN